MSNLKEEVTTVVDEVIEHTEGILTIVRGSSVVLFDAIEALKNLRESNDPDDAATAIWFLNDADALLESIGTRLSPKIETLSDTIDSVKHQLDLDRKESN